MNEIGQQGSFRHIVHITDLEPWRLELSNDMCSSERGSSTAHVKLQQQSAIVMSRAQTHVLISPYILKLSWLWSWCPSIAATKLLISALIATMTPFIASESCYPMTGS